MLELLLAPQNNGLVGRAKTRAPSGGRDEGLSLYKMYLLMCSCFKNEGKPSAFQALFRA